MDMNHPIAPWHKKNLVHHFKSDEEKKALRGLTNGLVAFTRDTMTYPPNGEWTDYTYNITDAEGVPFLVITAEVIRSCLCRQKRFDFKVMTPQGLPICSMHCKINIWRKLKIVFDREHKRFGSIAQPTHRPNFRLRNNLGIDMYRIDPEKYSESPCYGYSDFPNDMLVFTPNGFEIQAKMGIWWDEWHFPKLFQGDTYKRTSGVAVGFNPHTRLDCWHRLLLMGLHLSLKISNGIVFYDSGDFMEGFPHPERGWWDRRCNCHSCRPKVQWKWSASTPKSYNFQTIENFEPDDAIFDFNRVKDPFNLKSTNGEGGEEIQ